MPIEQRLWGRAQIQSGDNPCWIWPGCKNADGYGKIKFKGRAIYVHRLSYWLTHGRRMPRGGHVLHKCDNPSCFNPAHLQGGTQSTNMKHAYRRGRRKRSPKAPEEGT